MARLSISSFLAGAASAAIMVAVPATAAVRPVQADLHPEDYDGTAPC